MESGKREEGKVKSDWASEMRKMVDARTSK